LEQNSEEAREWEALLEQHTAGSAHLPLVEETVRTLLLCLTAYYGKSKSDQGASMIVKFRQNHVTRKLNGK
jgi:hypothetical protein